MGAGRAFEGRLTCVPRAKGVRHAHVVSSRPPRGAGRALLGAARHGAARASAGGGRADDAQAAGRFDSLVLRDLGGKTAALVQMVAADGAFAPVELWRSKKGAFDMRKATFVAGDVNGDGIGDGIVLYDLGRSRSRLLVYLSDGTRAGQKTAWTSRRGAFAKARARVAVGDVNRDGLDDVIALYARGKSGATLYRFTSTGTKFRQSTGWSVRRGYAWSRTQLAAGDVTETGATTPSCSTRARPPRRVSMSSSRARRSSARRRSGAAGTPPAAPVWQPATSTATVTATPSVCAAAVWRSSARRGKAFGKPAKWAGGAPSTSRFCVGDVTGDGRGDVVVATAAGTGSPPEDMGVHGHRFRAQTWWQGGWSVARTRLGVIPSVGIVVADGDDRPRSSSVAALRTIQPNGTFTFVDESAQLDGCAEGRCAARRTQYRPSPVASRARSRM